MSGGGGDGGAVAAPAPAPPFVPPMTHRLARHRRVPEGVLLELEPTPAAARLAAPPPLGAEPVQALVYKEHVDAALRAFVDAREAAGLYFAADVAGPCFRVVGGAPQVPAATPAETVHVRLLGHVAPDAATGGEPVYHDLCTLSKDGRWLLGRGGGSEGGAVVVVGELRWRCAANV